MSGIDISTTSPEYVPDEGAEWGGSGFPPPSQHSSRLVSAEKLRRHNIALAWILVALGGALFIVALSSSIVRMVVPCALMFGYLLYAWAQRSRDMEKVADSVYFLGFLWTLFALTHSLIVTSVTGIQARDVFSIFGYALVTTGWGMFLRMAVLQFRYTIPDQLTDGQEDLARQVQQFNEEVARTCAALSDFRVRAIKESDVFVSQWADATTQMRHAIMTAAVEGVAASKTATERLSREIASTADATKQTSASMANLGRATSSLVKRFETNQDKWATVLDAAAERTSVAIASWVDRVNRVESPSELFKTKVDEWTVALDAGIARTIQSMESWNGRVEKVQTPAEALKEKIGVWADALDEGAKKTTHTIDEWNHQVSQIEIPTATIRAKFGDWTQILEAGVGQSASAMSGWAQRVASSDVPSDLFARKTEQAMTPLLSAANGLSRGLNDVSHAASKARADFELTPPAIQALTTELTRVSHALNTFAESLTKSRESSRSWWRAFRG